MAEAMKKALDPALILLALAAFLAPLMGGQISAETLPSPSSVAISIFNGAETPVLSHALLGLLGIGALAVSLLRRKIIQVPNPPVAGLILTFLALTTSTLLVSAFRSQTVQYVCEFLLSGIVLFAVVAGAGRRFGPKLLLQALLAGTTLVAIQGIREYAQMKSQDATWRIFAGWVQPNAVAAMFLIGLFVGLALLANAERTEALLVGGASILIGIALVLTQSKGALLMGGVSGIVFMVLAWRWGGRSAVIRPLAVGAILFGSVLMISISQRSPSGPNAGSAINRITDVAKTGEQSAGFRSNLWKGTGSILAAHPIGVGLGVYRYYSAMSGLTTQTIFAHQSYLQLAVEASPIAPILLIAFFGLWGWHMLRISKTIPTSQNLMRAGVLCAVLAFLLHSLIDSDIYYFGIQYSIFILVGIGLLLAGDAVAPEAFPMWIRGSTTATGAIIAGGLLWLSTIESARSALESARLANDRNAVLAALESVRGFADFDGESCRQVTLLSPSPEEQYRNAQKLVSIAPNTSNLRLLAQLQVQAGQAAQARGTLLQAVRLDPNNIVTLTRLAEVERSVSSPDEYKKTLERIIDIESTSYFKVRSLPEFIPTETYGARLELAKLTSDAKARVSLLEPAVSGFAQYRDITVPHVLQMLKGGGAVAGGEDSTKMQAKLKIGIEAASALASAYRESGAAGKAGEAEAEGKRFADSLANLLK